MLRILSIASLLLVLTGCKKEIPDNCEGEYSFRRPYTTSHPLGRVLLGEPIILKVALPLNEYNFSSDSVVNIDRFNKVLCGFSVDEIKHDSTYPSGFKTVGIDNVFKYTSENVNLDLTPMRTDRNRVRFYLKKNATEFTATINLTPLRKGIFMIGLLNGIIEDAFCNAGIHCIWGNFTPTENINNFENFGMFTLTGETKLAWMTEKQSYFVLVE